MNYQITVSYGKYELTYLAHREKNTFYYDHNSPGGCSTINIRNKRLIKYNKINCSGAGTGIQGGLRNHLLGVRIPSGVQ